MKPQHYYSPNLFRSDYPFSHGTFVDLGTRTMVFLAGTISMGKDSFIDGDAFKQTEIAMKNIKTSLEEVGGTFRDIVKVIIFVSDMADVPMINKAYAKCFEGYDGYLPARCCFAVKELPYKSKLEIDTIAVVDTKVVNEARKKNGSSNKTTNRKSKTDFIAKF